MLNKGVAFGWFVGLPSWVGLLAMILVIVVAVKTRELWARFGLILMIIGGSINTYQRFTVGAVIDNLPMFGLGYNNWADYLIFFGVLVYGYTYFVRRRGSSRN
ncbi:MAG: hypothetical protein E6R05_01000 [Candidatus Moraniibacteriota bacterium]|nr:MAG: hypothetical protein E6R05_01000 [Candidatus Moranbacteria bacterium]